MAFKLRQPIKIDPVARYEVPFQPDNFEDKTGLVARANDNGNMIVNKNIPKDSKLRKVAESHEDHHLRDIMDGKLAYDDKAVYHNMDGKGMKRTPRSKFNESDKSLPWEAPAYAAGEKMEQKDMRPNPEKLDGPPNMYDDTPLAFVKQMGKRKRSADMDKVSMNERFGTAMVKKFGKGFNLEVNLDDTGDEGEKEKEKLKAQAKANAEAELAKKNYNKEVMPDGRIKFSKSAEGSASGEDNIVPGSKAKVVPENKLTTDPGKYVKDLIKSGKTREEVIEGSLVRKDLYDLFPSSKETATASDEYYETPPTTTPTKDTPEIEITTTELTDEDKKRFKLFKDKDPSCKLKKTKKGQAEVTCTNSGRSGIFGLKTEGGGVSTKSGEKLAKTEKKNRDRKVFAPVKAIKDAAALGKAGRKNKRGKSGAQRRMNRARRKNK